MWNQNKDLAQNFLKPYEVGVGTNSGGESLIHLYSQIFLDKSSTIVLTDFTNAFNLGNRQQALTLLEKHFPHLVNLFNCTFGVASPIYYGKHII